MEAFWNGMESGRNQEIAALRGFLFANKAGENTNQRKQKFLS